MARPGFTAAERGLIAAAAVLVFSRVFAFSLVLPGFRAFGATLTDSTFLVGLALGAYGLTMALAQLSNGWLSDRYGRRVVLLAGSAVFVLGSVWAAAATSIESLLAARLVQGLGGISSVAMAAVGETVPASRRTTAMALVGIPAGLGFFLGFLLGPVGEALIGFRGLFWATAVLGLAASLPLALRPLPPVAPPAPVPPRSSVPVAALAVAGFCVNAAMTLVAFFLPDLRPVALGGILLAALVVMGVASRALDRAGAVALPLAAALGLLALGAPLFTLRTGALLALGGLVFFSAHATLSAALPSQVSRLAGRSGGRGHGVQLVVAYLGSAAGGALAGGLAARPSLAFALFAVLCTVCAVACLAVLPRSTGPRPASEPSNQA